MSFMEALLLPLDGASAVPSYAHMYWQQPCQSCSRIRMSRWRNDLHLAITSRLIYRNVPQWGGILPVYDVSAVAHALDINHRQLDNILSRNDLIGVDRRARGVTRRVTPDAAVIINLALDLSTALRIPTSSAIRAAEAIAREPDHQLAVGDFASIRVDMAGLTASTNARLSMAVEIVGRRRRGRPPRRTSGGSVSPG